MNKLQVGQILYGTWIGETRRKQHNPDREFTITKIGNKYIYASSGNYETNFDKITLVQAKQHDRGDYGVDWKLYVSESEKEADFYNQKINLLLKNAVIDKFYYSSKKLSTDDAKTILKILGINYD